MTRYVFIPGAGGAAWYWSYVAKLLNADGHQAIPVELSGEDARLGLSEYVDLTCIAAGEESNTVLVAQSLGGFTAAMAVQRIRARALVLVNAMIPKPMEVVGDWWQATQATVARNAAAKLHGYSAEFDLQTYFLHDVAPEVIWAGEQYQRTQSETVFTSICAFEQWPALPIHVVAGAEDRFFPLEFQQRIARERLGVEPDVLPGGHLIALSQPNLLADYLGRI